MDVIGFQCVSLGSSTVQLHDSLGSRCACLEAGFSSQNGSILLFFLWAKGLNTKNIRKEMLPVDEGKCLSRKAVHNCFEKFSQGRSKVAVMPDQVALFRFRQKQLCSWW
jgi:hypothetical protein